MGARLGPGPSLDPGYLDFMLMFVCVFLIIVRGFPARRYFIPMHVGLGSAPQKLNTIPRAPLDIILHLDDFEV